MYGFPRLDGGVLISCNQLGSKGRPQEPAHPPVMIGFGPHGQIARFKRRCAILYLRVEILRVGEAIATNGMQADLDEATY
jgi:hypothetical protein